jgi:excinuclease ABC subunit B
VPRFTIYPKSHYVTRARPARGDRDDQGRTRRSARAQLRRRQAGRGAAARAAHAFDLEMMAELGYCSGIENYSRTCPAAAGRAAAVPVRLPAARRAAGRRREPRDHPAAGGHVPRRPRARRRWSSTASGCRRRWTTGRCSSRSGSGSRRRRSSSRPRRRLRAARSPAQVVEQVVRPTGLIDPEVEVRPAGTRSTTCSRRSRGASAMGERC